MSRPLQIPNIPEPWQAWLLPVEEFPCGLRDRSSLLPKLRQLATELAKEFNVEVLLQVWKLALGAGSEVLAEHAQPWWPINGIGVWPDREPPQSWTPELASDAAAGMYDGTEQRLPHHRLLRLSIKGRARIEAADKMRGFGTLLQLFSKLEAEELTERGREQFLPTIVDPFFRRAKFFLPLLDSTTLQCPRSAAQLDGWLCGTEVYLRESPEDRAILLLSRHDLSDALTRAGFDMPNGERKEVPHHQEVRKI